MGLPVKLNPYEEVLMDALPDGEAADALRASGLPHRRVEAWKWSDLRTVLSRLPAKTGAMVVKTPREADPGVLAVTEPVTLPARLSGLLGGPAGMFVLKGGERFTLDVSASEGASHRALVIEVPAGVSAVLHERYALEAGAFANIALDIRLGEGARLTRIIEQDAAPEAVLVVTGNVTLARNADYAQTTLGLGAKLARIETHLTHPGHGARVRLDSAYLLGEGLHLDQTSIVRHTGPNGVTEELSKGAVMPGGRGVFQGKIHVERAAQKTDARMNHRGLLLGDRAEIDAKPELEIYADDVACAHGNALGELDAEALFYMRQRGIPEVPARALLTESFLAEPLERIEDEVLRDGLLSRLRAALEAMR